MWKGTCFKGPVADLSQAEMMRQFNAAKNKQVVVKPIKRSSAVAGHTQTWFAATVTARPEFTIVSWPAKQPVSDGLKENPCWPSAIASADPGFALLTYDPFYNDHSLPYNYRAAYVKGDNGS